MITLIASLTLVMIIFIYFFRLGKIQDQILKRVTNTIKKEYEINLSINSSKVTLKDGVVLNDILILDHKEDTLVYLKKLKTNISSYQKLIDNEYRFSILVACFSNVKTSILGFECFLLVFSFSNSEVTC